MMKKEFENIEVLILCGGKGTRLRTIINDRPKPMAEIHGVPFLDILLDMLASHGLVNYILCIGHMGEYIERYYRETKPDLNIRFSRESKPLGTGGAIKNAQELIGGNHFIILNGDSYCNLDFEKFIDFHIQKEAALTIAVSDVMDSHDYGTISIDKEKRLISFNEKTNTRGRSCVNAGIYCMNKDIFSLMHAKDTFSLEYDFFPTILTNRCFAYITQQPFFDIGTPERYNVLSLEFNNTLK
ncbi:MAG: nucleotidyltransferase family protein [bacterium]